MLNFSYFTSAIYLCSFRFIIAIKDNAMNRKTFQRIFVGISRSDDGRGSSCNVVVNSLLLLARLINRQVEVFRGFGRRSP